MPASSLLTQMLAINCAFNTEKGRLLKKFWANRGGRPPPPPPPLWICHWECFYAKQKVLRLSRLAEVELLLCSGYSLFGFFSPEKCQFMFFRFTVCLIRAPWTSTVSLLVSRRPTSCFILALKRFRGWWHLYVDHLLYSVVYLFITSHIVVATSFFHCLFLFRWEQPNKLGNV